MSKARGEFYERMATFRDCVLEGVLSDGLPSDHQKNQVAAMYRSGLAVLAFAIAEAFFRDRTAEVLSGFNATISFGQLSEKLQNAVSINALRAILFKSSLVEKADQVSWTLGQLPPVANVMASVSALSAYSFGQGKSNVVAEDISETLSAYGVGGGWLAISAIAKRIGLGGVADYCQSFKGLANRRHAAAHDVTTRVPLNDLSDSIKEIVGICCSFDLLLSHSLSLHNLNQIPSKNSGLVDHTHIGLRFISPHPNKLGSYREQVEILNGAGLRTLKVHSTAADAQASALAACAAKRQQLIIVDSKTLPEKWFTW